MDIAIDSLSMSLRNDADVVRIISQNVANVQTTGFRRQIAIMSPSNGVHANAFLDNLTLLSTPRSSAAVDIRSGTLKRTGEALNVAIDGEGYFIVSSSAGDRVTRRGDFKLDSSGRLVTQDGWAVLGENGEIALSSNTPVIDNDGTVYDGDKIVDTLRRVNIAADSLVPADHESFAVKNGAALVDSNSNVVKQRYVETSNVTPVDEILRLVETTRHFEMTQHVMRSAQDMMMGAISTLGKI